MTEAEFLPLFDRYRSMVYGLALSYTRSPQDAEDMCQSVFLKLMEAPPAQGKERAWLAQVTVNHCRNLLTAAAVAVILTIGALAASGILSCTTYLTGGQATVRDGNDGYLYFEITGPSDPDFSPVEVRDGKVWLTTENGQALDITGQFSETEAYVYTYTDENDLIHDVLVGGTPDNYSCFEFLYHQDGSMDSVLGTYPDGYDGFHEPAWLIAYRQEQGIPVVEAESEMVQPAEETS